MGHSPIYTTGEPISHKGITISSLPPKWYRGSHGFMIGQSAPISITHVLVMLSRVYYSQSAIHTF